jgi:hypothetical protein
MNAQAKAKRTPAISAEITLEAPERGTSPNNKLTVTFADGRIINVMVSDLPQEIRAMALMHGLKQKLVDAAAISRNPDTGRSATVEDKFAAVRAVADQLFAGHWNAVRNGTGGSTSAGGLLFRALCRMYEGKKTPEQIREFLAGKSKAEQAALRGNKHVAAIIDDIKAEDDKNGTPDTGSDDLLAELEDGTATADADAGTTARPHRRAADKATE